MQSHSHFCSIFAILYFWVYGAILCAQGAIAVNRWALVCSSKYKYDSDKKSAPRYSIPPFKTINGFHFRFTKKTSVLAGGVSWITSALILLIPVFINGWKEFGYNESSGFYLSQCVVIRG